MNLHMFGTTTIGMCAAIALTTATTHADVLVDTISPGTWQNHPGWGLYTECNPFGVAAIGVRITGNGEMLSRFGMVVSLWDGSSQVAGVGPADARLHFGLFNNENAFLSADWSSSGDPLADTLAFDDENWNIPIGVFGGVSYYYVEVDLTSMEIALPAGQQLILGAAYQNVNPGLPHAGVAQGALQGPFGGDYYALGALGYVGTVEGFVSQYGFPPQAGVTNAAAFVSTVAPPNPFDLDGDGAVNAADLAILLGGWGGAVYDLTGDGVVDAADIGALLGAWTG